MASADFCPSQAVSPLLVAALAGFASPPPAVGQTSPGKNNNLPPMYPPHLLRCAPGSGRALFCLANSPTHLSLICGFCSSGRDFAAGFLQIPPHDGHPCLWLTLLAAKRVADSHRRVIAHAGRTKKRQPTGFPMAAFCPHLNYGVDIQEIKRRDFFQQLKNPDIPSVRPISQRQQARLAWARFQDRQF